MSIKSYTIVEASTVAALVSEVNYHIARGWKPIGGVAVLLFDHYTATPPSFIQAMIHEE